MSQPTIKRVGKTYDGHPRYEVTKNGYVNARWKSKRRYWRTCRANGSTIMWALETRKRALRDFET